MATPPPLIRSTKPFSVEIPEGSNSAKARRSDVVGSDELSISAKKTDFKTSDAALLPEIHHEAESELATRSAQHADALSSEDMRVKEESGLLAPNMAHDDSHTEKNIQQVGANALIDRHIDLPPSDALKKNLQAVDKDNLKDNLQAVAQDPLTHQDVGIAKEHLKDNIAAEPHDDLHSNDHGLPKDALKDRTAGETHSPLQDRQAAAAKDAIRDNLQSLSDDTLEDNLQPLDSHSIEDNQPSIDNPAIRGNQPSLANDSMEDNLQAVDNPALDHNQAGLDADTLENRTAETDKEHVQDHVVALPDQRTTLKDGPKPGNLNKAGRSNHDDKRHPSGKTSAGKTSAQSKDSLNAEAEQLQAAKLEQARKMGEFHGRVEALKKTVSGINHLLDELEEKKPEKKS